MKKKIITVLCLCVIATFALNASFVQFGPSYTIDFPIDTAKSTPVEFDKLDFSRFHLGADLRLNFGSLVLEQEIKAFFSDQLLLESFDIYASMGFKAKLAFMDFIIGGGLKCAAAKDSKSQWLFNGLGSAEAKDYIMSSTLFYRGAVDINLGRRVTFALSVVAPTTQTPEKLNSVQNISVIEALTPTLTATTVTAGLLFNFF